jgi:hypothetical protein
MKQDIFDEYVEKVSYLFRIDKAHLFNNCKKQDYVDARYLLYYLCSLRPMRVKTIQGYMKENGYDVPHSIVCRGISVFAEKIQQDRDYQNLVRDIQNSITI